ncbi:tyrosine-type recombinase/integrase [Methylorubrum populi]|uniref:tyrosine-type recombinase/integrase n=1 Tax=Methylorubrum rhodesianum TaxID=29427 RepID=UPI00190CBBCA|nr:tyrosine-type recombinase/integrase [Methylorubrum rhodesianum]MBK3404178.1 tyrosine-type recombinase/integrase [Methylorubrum rhodesianum]MBY0142968.1 tyrosine-type recombinase/integrase [Methylorubrum populi]
MRETMQAGALGRAAEDIRVALMTAAAAIPENERRRGPPPMPPHLIERRSKSDPGRSTLYIRDGKLEISTRLPPDRHADADTLLDLYKLQKGAKERGIVAPRMVPVVAALAHLLDADKPVAKPTKDGKPPKVKGALHIYLMRSTRLATLARFFGEATFKDVTTAKCKEFIEWRTSLPDARYRPGTPDAPLAKEASAREDLFELRKAIDLYADEYALAWHPEVYVPKAGGARTRWLRPVEIDRIYWAIRGRIWDPETNGWKTETVADEDGKVVTRRVLRPPETVAARKVLRRFVYLGCQTGTRNTAMRELKWHISAEGGCIDLDDKLIHRRGFGLDPSKGKPRASSQISGMAANTMRRWREADLAAGIDHVIHKLDGSPYESSPACIWRSTMQDAGLGDDVVPHTLRHTAATVLRIAKVDVRKAADLLGMAIQTMVRVYGQWTLEGQEEAAEALANMRRMKSMPLLALVTPSTQPVVMADPANDDAETMAVRPTRRRSGNADNRAVPPAASVSRPLRRSA